MSRAKHNLLNLGHLSHETRFCLNCCMDLSHNITWLVSGTLFATRIHLFAPFLLAEINPLAKTRVSIQRAQGWAGRVGWTGPLRWAGLGGPRLGWLGLAVLLNTQYCSILLITPQCSSSQYYSILSNTIQYYSTLFNTSHTIQHWSILSNTIQYYSTLLSTAPYYSIVSNTIQYYSILFNTAQTIQY